MNANHSSSFWQRICHGIRRMWCREDWESLLGTGWSDRILTAPVTDRFHTKQGRSTGRLILQSGEQRLVVYLKRHYRLSRWRGFLAALWPAGNWSPATQEASNLEWARSAGVPVPAVVATGEFIGPWGRLQSFLAVEELADMLPLNEVIPLAARQLDPASFRRWKDGLLSEMARLTRLLHQRRRFHKDLYLCHFYLPRQYLTQSPENWRGCVHLIDLHRLSHHRRSWRFWQTKDLAQLLYSAEIPGITLRDLLRFWRYYHGFPSETRGLRLVRWIVQFRWARYRRHNLRRQPVPNARTASPLEADTHPRAA